MRIEGTDEIDEEVDVLVADGESEDTKTASRRKNVIKKWSARHTRILMLVSKGMMTHVEIGQKVGLHPNQVSYIIKTTTFQEKLRSIEDERKRRVTSQLVDKLVNNTDVDKAVGTLVKNVPQAARKIVKLMRDGENSQRLQFDAAKEILHIAGIKPIEVIETRERDYSPDEIFRAKETLDEVTIITERLSNTQNQFVLRHAGHPRESVTDESSQQASKDRQETGST